MLLSRTFGQTLAFAKLRPISSGHHKAAEEEGNHGIPGKLEERNIDGRFQLQLEEDGGGSTTQNLIEMSALWPLLH